MSFIRAVCTDCGDVVLKDVDITVSLPGGFTSRATYAFKCPSCHRIDVHEAGHHVVDILLAAGCKGIELAAPLELIERVNYDPSITHDEVLNFYEKLRDFSGNILDLPEFANFRT